MSATWGSPAGPPTRRSGIGAPRVGPSERPSRVPRVDESVRHGAHLEVPAPDHDLAARQNALVAALVAGGPPPPGFDPARLDATRRALLRKRAGEAAKAWPLLAASLGDGWGRTFARHRDGHEPVGALRDGWDVARTLRAKGELGGGAAEELAERERAMRYDGAAAPRPRLRARIAGLLRRP